MLQDCGGTPSSLSLQRASTMSYRPFEPVSFIRTTLKTKRLSKTAVCIKPTSTHYIFPTKSYSSTTMCTPFFFNWYILHLSLLDQRGRFQWVGYYNQIRKAPVCHNRLQQGNWYSHCNWRPVADQPSLPSGFSRGRGLFTDSCPGTGCGQRRCISQ